MRYHGNISAFSLNTKDKKALAGALFNKCYECDNDSLQLCS